MASVLWNWQMLDADGVWGERSDYEATRINQKGSRHDAKIKRYQEAYEAITSSEKNIISCQYTQCRYGWFVNCIVVSRMCYEYSYKIKLIESFSISWNSCAN